MGNLLCKGESDEDSQAILRDQAITKLLRADEKKMAKQVKLLLLGRLQLDTDSLECRKP
jgi:hypothetical protein